MTRYNELLDNPDELERMRREGEQHARSKREQRRSEQRAIDVLRAEMRQEIANLRNELEIFKEACGTVIGEYADKVIDHDSKMIRDGEPN